MDQPVLMRALQSQRRLPRHFTRIGNWQRAFPLDQRLQIHALDEFHGHKVPAAHDARVGSGDEVRRLEPAHGPRLPLKAGEARGVRYIIGGEKFDSDDAVQKPMAGLKHQPHIASDLLEDFIVLDHVAWLWSGRVPRRRVSASTGRRSKGFLMTCPKAVYGF